MSSEHDWLITGSGDISTKPFLHIEPWPGGHDAHRSEIILTAFGAAVTTIGKAGITWIVGEPAKWLPDGLSFERICPNGGRIAAFAFAGAS